PAGTGLVMMPGSPAAARRGASCHHLEEGVPTVAVNGFPALVVLVLAQAAPSTAPAVNDAKSPAEGKAAFLKLLDGPKVPLDVRAESAKEDEATGLVVERLSFATEKKPDGTVERVPALVVRPSSAGGRRPAVIVLHGTGGNKDAMRGWLDD